MSLKTEIEKLLDGFEKDGHKFDYNSGVLKVAKDGKAIFEERIDEPFFTDNLVEEISDILHHHELYEADKIVSELLKIEIAEVVILE